MSWQNVLALAVFVCVCGFIAYAGDVLGRRMGKRRLSLFGLRPRHTAIVTTSITGMLIAMFTIAVMAVASTHVRELVLRGAEIVQKYEAARKQSETATKELERQKSITEKAQTAAKKAVRFLANEIALVRKNLSKLRADLKRSEAALRGTKEQFAEATQRLEAADREIEERSREIDELQEERSMLVQDVQAVLGQLGEATARWQRYIALRERTVIFRSNEELARRVIRCAQPKGDIRADILGLLSDADKRAQTAGATVGDNGRAVRILPVKTETGDAGEGRFLTDTATIDAVVDNISGGSGSVVALVVAVGNSVEGEQTLVLLQSYYNRLIYSGGQEVASVTIDGSAPRGEILGNLLLFLRQDVRSAAMSKKVIPEYDEDGQPSVGQIPWDRVLEVVDRIKAAGKSVRVTALAANDTWSAGPLDLDLVVSDSR